jgi:hypothetical protein
LVPTGKRLGSLVPYAMKPSCDPPILPAQCVGQLMGLASLAVILAIPK